MCVEEFIKRATDKQQYDNPNLPWNKHEYSLQSPDRKWIFSYLSKFKEKWGGKVVDIGCGTGWLVNEIQNVAKYVVGIDPSKKNCERGKQLFPSIDIRQLDVYSFSDIGFDLAIAIMVFVHLEDLNKAFNHIRGMLKKGGEFQLIIPDFDYLRRPIESVTIEYISEQECVMEIRSNTGTVVDLVRKPDIYKKIAGECGFKLLEHIPMIPTEHLLKDKPKYKEWEGKPILHLLRYKVIGY